MAQAGGSTVRIVIIIAIIAFLIGYYLYTRKSSSDSESSTKSSSSKSKTKRISYNKIVEGTIDEVKEAADEKDLDYEKLLEAEKDNKDRKTLKNWIERQIE